MRVEEENSIFLQLYDPAIYKRKIAVASLSAVIKPGMKPGTIEINSLAVWKEKHRKMGYGRKIVEDFLNRLPEHIHTVIVQSGRDVVNFYRTFGFRISRKQYGPHVVMTLNMKRRS